MKTWQSSSLWHTRQQTRSHCRVVVSELSLPSQHPQPCSPSASCGFSFDDDQRKLSLEKRICMFVIKHWLDHSGRTELRMCSTAGPQHTALPRQSSCKSESFSAIISDSFFFIYQPLQTTVQLQFPTFFVLNFLSPAFCIWCHFAVADLRELIMDLLRCSLCRLYTHNTNRHLCNTHTD